MSLSLLLCALMFWGQHHVPLWFHAFYFLSPICLLRCRPLIVSATHAENRVAWSRDVCDSCCFRWTWIKNCQHQELVQPPTCTHTLRWIPNSCCGFFYFRMSESIEFWYGPRTSWENQQRLIIQKVSSKIPHAHKDLQKQWAIIFTTCSQNELLVDFINISAQPLRKDLDKSCSQGFPKKFTKTSGRSCWDMNGTFAQMSAIC